MIIRTALVASSLVACAETPEVAHVEQAGIGTTPTWSLIAGPSTSPSLVQSGTPLHLRELRLAKDLVRQSQSCGVSLEFAVNDANNMRVVSPSGSGVVTYGANVALYFAGIGFLAGGSEVMGVSTSPTYEWQILGGNLGEPVETLDAIVLHDVRFDDELVHCAQSCGVDLGWASACQ